MSHRLDFFFDIADAEFSETKKNRHVSKINILYTVTMLKIYVNQGKMKEVSAILIGKFE